MVVPKLVVKKALMRSGLHCTGAAAVTPACAGEQVEPAPQ